MTDDKTTPDTTTDIAADAATTQPVAPDDHDAGKGNREAMKYRHRARDADARADMAEAQRDQLAARVDTLQRAEVERLTAELIRPADFFEAGDGMEIADVRDEAGDIDEAKIAARLDALRAERVYLFTPKTTFTARTGDETRGRPGTDMTWGQALKSE